MNNQEINPNSSDNFFNYHSSFKTRSGQEASLEGRQVSEKGKSEIKFYRISLLFDLSRLQNLEMSQQQHLEKLFSESKIIVDGKHISLNTNKIEDVSKFLSATKTLIPASESRELQNFIQRAKLDIEDQYIDEDMLLNTEKLFDENLCEMPPNTPFSDTDLIILKDTYLGSIPKNGIKESDFKTICNLYNTIEKNETSIKIDESNDRPNILNLIKTLLTRDIGRRLIQKCASQEQAVLIKSGENPGYNTYQKSGYSGPKIIPDLMNSNSVIIDFSNKYFYHEMKPNGEKVLSSSWPLHVMLAHELVHHLHYSTIINDRLEKPTFESDYHDLEEQKTITGYAREPEIVDFIPKDKLAEYDDLFERGLDTTKIFQSLELLGQKKEVYDEFNERAIMNAFTDSRNVFYPRSGHTGVKKTLEEARKTSLKNLSNTIESLKNEPAKFLKVIAEAKETIFQLPLSVQQLVFNKVNEFIYAAETPQSPNYLIFQNPQLKAQLNSFRSLNRERDTFLRIKENALEIIRNPENRQFLREVDGYLDELIEIHGQDEGFMMEVSKYGL